MRHQQQDDLGSISKKVAAGSSPAGSPAGALDGDTDVADAARAAERTEGLKRRQLELMRARAQEAYKAMKEKRKWG